MEKENPEEHQASEETLAEEAVAETEEEVSEEQTNAELEEILAEEEPVEKTAGVEEEAEIPAEEEEVKPPKRKRKEEEAEFVEERIYTIPLGKAWVRPPKKRAPRAIHMIKAFITKHMKLAMRVEEEEEAEELPKLIISADVNEKVWRRGIEKPPRKIRVRAAKDKDGNVTIFLAEGE